MRWWTLVCGQCSPGPTAGSCLSQYGGSGTADCLAPRPRSILMSWCLEDTTTFWWSQWHEGWGHWEWEPWVRFPSLTWSKLRQCSANHRAGYFSNLACDWLSIVWAYSKQETENGPRLLLGEPGGKTFWISVSNNVIIVNATIAVTSHEHHGIANHWKPLQTTKKISKLCITGPLWGNPLVSSGFPSQRASTVARVSMS